MRVLLVTAAALAFALPAAAAEPPTISANVSIVGRATPLILSGTVPSGAEGESVVVEAKDCGGSFYRAFGGATTTPGGVWSYRGWVRTSTTFRAKWKGAVSTPVLVRQRAQAYLGRIGRTRIFLATVYSHTQPMDGRVVRLERLTPSGWVLVRTAKLRTAHGRSPEARFRVVQKGLQLRVFVPESSAKPCYVAGVSQIVRS